MTDDWNNEILVQLEKAKYIKHLQKNVLIIQRGNMQNLL